MKTVLRDDDTGVSEVVGTILILAMTVVLFSSIILWVGSIPTPTVQPRVDLKPFMTPVFDGSGNEIAVNITLLHRGVESLNPAITLIFVTWTRGGGPPTTDRVILHTYDPLLGTPSGLLDGTNAAWDIGERWAYVNFLLRSTDDITVTVVDNAKNSVVWSSKITAPEGARPPVFVSKWAEDLTNRSQSQIDPIPLGAGFIVFARVVDPDNDLDPDSVYATLTIWFGVNDPCADPQPMRDDGVDPDRIAGDGTYTLGGIPCMNPPYPLLTWDDSVILLNATDAGGRETKTRMSLSVIEPFTGGGIETIPSQLWQYIGFIHVRAEEAWFTHMNEPTGTTNRFPLGRVQRSELNGGGGALFHLLMANHGNRTVFVDGFTAMSFRSASSSNVVTIYVVCPVPTDPAGNPKCTVNPANPASSGGLDDYPGTGAFTNFEYAQVLDINPFNQEAGGTPVDVMAFSRTRFECCLGTTWGADSFYPSILMSGISGPVNMTYQQIINRWGASYNPYTHLNDADPTTRTQWYAQVIPFIAMTVIG